MRSAHKGNQAAAALVLPHPHCLTGEAHTLSDYLDDYCQGQPEHLQHWLQELFHYVATDLDQSGEDIPHLRYHTTRLRRLIAAVRQAPGTRPKELSEWLHSLYIFILLEHGVKQHPVATMRHHLTRLFQFLQEIGGNVSIALPTTIAVG